MKKAPSWLVELATRCGQPDSPSLWVGPPLAFGDALRMDCGSVDARPRDDRAYGAVWIARAEGELRDVVRAVRPACAPGATLGLLLPQSGGGVRGLVRGLLGPLGREGRAPRSLTDQCGALLSCGAGDIEVVSLGPGGSCVTARLPRVASSLDSVWTF